MKAKKRTDTTPTQFSVWTPPDENSFTRTYEAMVRKHGSNYAFEHKQIERRLERYADKEYNVWLEDVRSRSKMDRPVAAVSKTQVRYIGDLCYDKWGTGLPGTTRLTTGIKCFDSACVHFWSLDIDK